MTVFAIWDAVETDAAKPGDFNRDGEFDCRDIDWLTNAVAMGSTDPMFDLNADGQVNRADVSTWLQLAGEHNLGPGRSYLPGDANLDSWVDGRDFGIWNSRKFSLHAGWCGGDFSADGFVDGSDFGIWNSNKFVQAADSHAGWSQDFRKRRELPAEVWDAALLAIQAPTWGHRHAPGKRTHRAMVDRTTDGKTDLGNVGPSTFARCPHVDCRRLRPCRGPGETGGL